MSEENEVNKTPEEKIEQTSSEHQEPVTDEDGDESESSVTQTETMDAVQEPEISKEEGPKEEIQVENAKDDNQGEEEEVAKPLEGTDDESETSQELTETDEEEASKPEVSDDSAESNEANVEQVDAQEETPEPTEVIESTQGEVIEDFDAFLEDIEPRKERKPRGIVQQLFMALFFIIGPFSFILSAIQAYFLFSSDGSPSFWIPLYQTFNGFFETFIPLGDYTLFAVTFVFIIIYFTAAKLVSKNY